MPAPPPDQPQDGGRVAPLDLRGRDLRGRDLRGLDLRGALLADADLRGAPLAGLDLEGADLSDCDLAGADLRGARLAGARLVRVRAAGLLLSGADLSRVDLSGATLPDARLEGARLVGALAAEAMLAGMRAEGADLSGLRAPYAALDRGRLDGVDLRGAELLGATLEGASLRQARLDGAVLRRARLGGADLEGATLDGVQAAGARLGRVALSEAQRAALEAGGLRQGPGLLRRLLARLWAWSRGGGPLRGLQAVAVGIGWPLRALVGALGRLRVALAERRAARPVVAGPGLVERGVAGAGRGLGALRGLLAQAAQGLVRLSGLARGAGAAELGPGARLAGRDLRGVDLRGLDLRGADLRGAFLDGADLRGAQLGGARLDAARMRRARLEGASLVGASAADVVLDEAQLEGADLSGLQAAGARLVGAALGGVTLAGAALRGADLSAARLVDVDLADVDLSFALLEQTDLAGARLDRAVVRGAEVAGALGLGRAERLALRERGADIGGLPVGRLGLERLLAGLRALPGLALGAAQAAARTGLALGRLLGRGLAALPGLLARVGAAALAGGVRAGAAALAALRWAGRTARSLLEGARQEARRAVERLRAQRERLPSGAVAQPWAESALERAQGAYELADAGVRGFGEGLRQSWAGQRSRLVAEAGERLALALRAAQERLAGAWRASPALLQALVAQAPGLLTLGAALALIGYLGARFWSVENLDERVVEQQAVEQVQLGATEEALQRYQALLDRSESPADRAVWRAEMAAVLAADGRRPEAVAMLRLGVEEAGEDPELRVEALLRLAEGLRAMGDFEQEAQAWLEALAVQPVPAALRARAIGGAMDAAVRLGDPAGAQALLQAQLDAVAGQPSASLDLRVALAEVLVARGDYDRALAVLDAFWESSPSPAQAARLLAALAATHEARGALAESLATWERLFREHPQHLGSEGQAWLSAAAVALRRGETAQAARWLDALFAQGASPRVEAQATLLKARIEREEGRPNTAALLYRQVLTRFPGDADAVAAAQLGLAETLWAVDEASAEELAARLMASGDPELVAQVLVGRARITHRRGDGDGARGLYAQVLEGYPDTEAARTARAGLAELELEEGRFAEAIRALRALQAEGEQGPAIEAGIGEALLRSGNLDDAELAFRTLAQTYAPGSEGALLGALGLARVAEARGDLEQARAGYERVLAATTDPGLTTQALEALASLWVQAGREDEAMAAYRRTLQALPEQDAAVFDIRLSMAGILQRRGEWAQAEAQLLALRDAFTTPARQAEVELALAGLLEAQGDAAGALARYRALLEDPALPLPQRDDVVVGLARATLATGDAGEALALCERWTPRLVEESTVAVLRDLHVQALRALGRSAEADALAGTAPEGEADPLTVGMAAAAAQADAGDFEAALAGYQALLDQAQEPDLRGALALSIAQTLAQSGQLEAARQAYRQVLTEHSEAPDLCFSAEMGLAWVERLEGEPARAVARYAALLGPDAGSEVWRLEQLAQAHAEAGDDAQARAAWKRLLREHAADPAALAVGRAGLAAQLHAEGELTAARALYEQVARSAPDAASRQRAALSAAMILVDEGRGDEARARLEALLGEAQDPEVLLQARIGLSAVLLEQGSPARARRALEGVDPEALGPAFGVAWTQQLAACWLADGEPEAARQAWEEVQRRWPEDEETATQARLALADIALGQGEAAQAEALYRAALEGSPDRALQARALLGLAHALRARGQGEEAAALLDRLIREYPEQGELISVASAARGGG